MASETRDEKDSSGDGSPSVGEEEKKVDSDPEEEETKEEEKEEAEEEEVEEEKEEKEEEKEKKERGKKRGRKKKNSGEEEMEGTEKKERKRRSVEKEAATPVSRPSRERKTVERYSELTPRSSSAKKAISIGKGSGIMLKDIPNVSFKLSKRKGDENLQALHTILYGRKSNAHFLKRNILQFSGFVWTENEEKQKARVKEKLDKCGKERLLDFCDILDIHLKATTKKEEVSSKLLEFLESPHVTRDLVLAEREKGKKRGRTKGTSRTTSADTSVEKEAKRRRKNSKQSVEVQEGNDDDDISADSKDASADEEDNEDSVQSDHSKSEDEEDEVEEPAASKKVSGGEKPKQKGVGSRAKEKNLTVQKTTTAKAERSPSKGLSKKNALEDESDEQDASKDKSRRDSKTSLKGKNKHVKKDSGSLESSPKKRGKTQSSKAATQNDKASKKHAGKLESKASTKKQGKGKGRGNASSGPSTEELHAVVAELLKEVDFDTATLADILRQLGAHFKMDLMDRKTEVKRIVEDVINSMSGDEDGGEDEDEDGNEGEDGAEGSEGEDTKEDSDGNGDK